MQTARRRVAPEPPVKLTMYAPCKFCDLLNETTPFLTKMAFRIEKVVGVAMDTRLQRQASYPGQSMRQLVAEIETSCYRPK